MIFGRFGRFADIIVDCNGNIRISRNHGSISLDGGNLVYNDTSKNGSLVETYNGEKIPTRRGDVVTLIPADFDGSEKSVRISFANVQVPDYIPRTNYTLEIILKSKELRESQSLPNQ